MDILGALACVNGKIISACQYPKLNKLFLDITHVFWEYSELVDLFKFSGRLNDRTDLITNRQFAVAVIEQVQSFSLY
jgi:hypothetical protein